VVAGGGYRPFQQLMLEGILRAEEGRMAWLSCRGQYNLCDTVAFWPPFCYIFAPGWLPRYLLELGSSATLFPLVLDSWGCDTTGGFVSLFFCFVLHPL
jgi:hypothetical protein